MSENNNTTHTPLKEQAAAPSLRERIHDVLQNKITGSLLQLLKGIGLAGAAAAGGVPAVIGFAAALICLSIYRQNASGTNQKKSLLRVYKQDVAEILHKDADHLNVDDLEQAAKKGLVPVAQELKVIDHNCSFFNKAGVTSTIITAALTCIGAAFVPLDAFKEIIGMGVIAGISKATHSATSSILSRASHEGGPRSYVVNTEVSRLQQAFKERPLVPEQVFVVVVESNRLLKKQIRDQYGDDYKNLTIMQKREVVAAHDSTYHTAAVTQAVNDQKINVSKIGMLAFGPEYFAQKAAAPLATEPAGTFFRDREQARAQVRTAQLSTTLH